MTRTISRPPYGPKRLAVCRILSCATLFCIHINMDYTAFCTLPDEFWAPISLFSYLQIPRLSAEWIITLQIVLLASLGLCVVGVAVRLGATIALLSSVYLMGFVNCFGKVSHGDTIVPFILLILATSRCDDAYAIWPSPKKRDHGDDASIAYRWPIEGVWILFGLIFGAAGIAKLRYGGMEWIFSDNMSHVLRLHYLSPDAPSSNLAHWIADSHYACVTMAAAGVLFESFAPLVVFSRTARLLIVPGIALMMLGFSVLFGFTCHRYVILFIWFIPFDQMPFTALRRTVNLKPQLPAPAS
jgi:hypothetical protein